MSRQPDDRGQNSGYQAYVSRFVQYLLRCPTKGRPKDCIHGCPRYMHSGLCEPCTQFVELECYCEATGIVKPCLEWCDMVEAQKELIKCCRVRCAKTMECGHQCPQICHPGKCADPKQCVESVVRHCHCARIERIFPCRGCGAKDQQVPCDEICSELLETYRQAIAEMKSNPFQQQNAKKTAVENGASSGEDELGVEAEEIKPPQKLSPENGINESESGSGSNEGNKNSEDDGVDIIPSDAEITSEVGDGGGTGGETERGIHSLKVATDLPAELTAEQAADSLSIRSDELHTSLDSEHRLKKSQSRLSRSSSRVSNCNEEDAPRQLGRDKVVNIMRSSTRKKKLIKCNQSEVINVMRSSS